MALKNRGLGQWSLGVSEKLSCSVPLQGQSQILSTPVKNSLSNAPQEIELSLPAFKHFPKDSCVTQNARNSSVYLVRTLGNACNEGVV